MYEPVQPLPEPEVVVVVVPPVVVVVTVSVLPTLQPASKAAVATAVKAIGNLLCHAMVDIL
jgi:hypothetical protein